jgi:hypothetical protein
MLTFYTDRIIPNRFSGYSIGPVILIRPSYKSDVGLLEHEKTHRRQWLRTCGLHSLLYPLSPSYRLRSEAEAYAKQIEHTASRPIDLFSFFICSKYGLKVTEKEAKDAILSFLPDDLRHELQ